jgi:hypothetical protein
MPVEQDKPRRDAAQRIEHDRKVSTQKARDVFREDGNEADNSEGADAVLRRIMRLYGFIESSAPRSIVPSH